MTEPADDAPAGVAEHEAQELILLAGRLRHAIGRIARMIRPDSNEGSSPLQMSVLVLVERHGPLFTSELVRLEGSTRAPTM